MSTWWHSLCCLNCVQAGLIRTFNEVVTEPSELWLYSDLPLEQRAWLLERVRRARPATTAALGMHEAAAFALPTPRSLAMLPLTLPNRSSLAERVGSG